MELSAETKHLLAQHLFWINKGYDCVKIKEVIGTLSNENPFRRIKLNHLQNIIGRTNSDDFEPEELEKLTYLYPYLIDFDGNLSFLKHCENLNEVDFTSVKVFDIGDLKYLNNLTRLDLGCNKISSVNALKSSIKIEELILENCDLDSLEPILHHKTIKKIVLGNVENEDDILNIISNQEAVSAVYYIENKTELNGLFFPRYLVCVNLEKEILTISMTSIVTNKFERFCAIPSEMIADKIFVGEYIKLVETELDKRIKSILKTNYEIIENVKFYTNEEIEFGAEVRIEKIKNKLHYLKYK